MTRRLLDGLTGIRRARVLGPIDLENRRGVVSFAIDGLSAEQICRLLTRMGWPCGVAIIVRNRSFTRLAWRVQPGLALPPVARTTISTHS
jgi:selenocysteine lyase/cysteine desulfurase